MSNDRSEIVSIRSEQKQDLTSILKKIQIISAHMVSKRSTDINKLSTQALELLCNENKE